MVPEVRFSKAKLWLARAFSLFFDEFHLSVYSLAFTETRLWKFLSMLFLRVPLSALVLRSCANECVRPTQHLEHILSVPFYGNTSSIASGGDLITTSLRWCSLLSPFVATHGGLFPLSLALCTVSFLQCDLCGETDGRGPFSQ